MANAVLDRIKDKVHVLMSDNSSLKQENISLKNKVVDLESVLTQQKSEIDEINEKIKMLKMAKSLSGDSEGNKEMKLKINELVREIDKCISLLNK